MARKSTVVLAMLLVAVAHRVGAQSTSPATDGTSIVMRCQDCGRIESIREVQPARPTSTSSASGSASESPIGLVMYIPLGRKSANDETYMGSVGSRQWQERTQNISYEFTVRMDNDKYQFAQKQGVSDLAVGDRVKVSRGQIERWTGQ